MNLLESYSQYLRSGSFEESEPITHRLINEPYEPRLLDMYLDAPKLDVPTSKLKSNGSSGNWQNQIYYFGPYFNKVRQIIERKLRCPLTDTPQRQLLMLSPYPDPWTDQDLADLQTDRIYFDLPNEQSAVEACKLLDKALQVDERGLTIRTFPRIINVLNSSAAFLDFCRKYTDRLTVACTDSDAFYDARNIDSTGVLVNNQMINWKSGVNFYSDKDRAMYSLRNLWGQKDNRFYNLLNLANKEGCEVDDYISFGSNGRISMFLPHINHIPKKGTRFYYDLSLAERFVAKYLNVQFLYDNELQPDHIEMHVISKSDKSLVNADAELVSDRFDLEVRIVKDSAFWIGRKYMTFWGVPSRAEYRQIH